VLCSGQEIVTLEHNEIVSLLANLELLSAIVKMEFEMLLSIRRHRSRRFFNGESMQWALLGGELEAEMQQYSENFGLSRTGNIAQAIVPGQTSRKNRGGPRNSGRYGAKREDR
jgi:hypothetical protein